MRYAVLRARDIDHDLSAIFDFLFESHKAFGEDDETAFARAAARIHGIEDAMAALSRAPHQGTLREEILPGLRAVTKDRAIFYFDVDDESRTLRVLAVFFGGQDHQRRMLARVLGMAGGAVR